MIVSTDNKITIKTIEVEDIDKVLEIYEANDFDYKEIEIEPKPSISEMRRVLTNIINKKLLELQLLVVEKEDNIIGYALIERMYPDVYYLSQLVITELERNKGYGKYLLNKVKELAKIDNSNIELDTLPKTGIFFEKEGFTKTNYCYSYNCQNIVSQVNSKIFYTEDEVKEKNKEYAKEQIEKSKVFLKKIKNI